MFVLSVIHATVNDMQVFPEPAARPEVDDRLVLRLVVDNLHRSILKTKTRPQFPTI